MLFSQATLIFLTLLVSTRYAAADYHARVVRRGDAGTASSSVYNTTSTGAAAVIATASYNSTISASVVSSTAASATASSWPMHLGPGVNASASLTFFTLYQNMTHIYDGMTIPIPIVAFYGGGCTSLKDLNTARDWDDKAEGYYFSSSEAKKGQCKVWALPECTGRVMDELEGGDEPRRFRDGMAGRVLSFMCWKS